MRNQTILKFAGVILLMISGKPAFTMRGQDGHPGPVETKEQHDSRMAWWRQARFGMFIHWGLYAEAGGSWKGKNFPNLAEWIMNDAKIPVAEYAALADTFNPVKFDADRWVSVAKQAGMKYIVVTAKHHDGFAMFHTSVDRFNIYDGTPFRRDPLAELAAACQRGGIKLGFYYSQAQDWHHPGGSHRNEAWDPAQEGNMDDYVKTVAAPQVKELLTKFGPVAVLWWDTPFGMNPERAGSLASLLKLQPAIITNDRLGGGYLGDTGTPEGSIPPYPETDHDWETCMTINGTWGYRPDALAAVRTPRSLLLDLISTASKGGNYLLNVGPDPLGEIPAVEAENLRAMGDWLKKNGESIYGTAASPWRKKPVWGRVTQRPGKLYLHVLDRPANGIVTVPIRGRASHVYPLSAPTTSLEVAQTPAGMTIRLPDPLPDTVDTVVIVELGGPLDLLPEDHGVPAFSDGSIRCGPADVQIIHGDPSASAHQTGFGGDEEHPFLKCDGNSGGLDKLQWQGAVEKAGSYDVIVNYAMWPYHHGNGFTVSIGEQKLTAVVETTKDGYKGQDFKVGTVQIAKSGMVPITFEGLEVKRAGILSRLFSVTLKPSGQR